MKNHEQFVAEEYAKAGKPLDYVVIGDKSFILPLSYDSDAEKFIEDLFSFQDNRYHEYEDYNHNSDQQIEPLSIKITDVCKICITGYEPLKSFFKHNMVKKLKERNINVVVHIINGLPYETEEMMIETVKHLNELNIDGIKIHMLAILKDTPLEKYYYKNKFKVLTKDEYISIVIKQLEYLNPKIVIHRLTEDPIKEDLIEPKWLTKKIDILNNLDKIMSKRDICQGDKIKEK